MENIKSKFNCDHCETVKRLESLYDEEYLLRLAAEAEAEVLKHDLNTAIVFYTLALLISWALYFL